jgi:acyl-coenzyme A thioesterase PaaI-like protein
LSPETAAIIERVQAAYGHGCFACGRNNHIGLHLELIGLDGGEVTARFHPRDDHRGAPAILHGGIASTAIDEVMVWAGILAEGVMTVTGTLDLRFRRPLPVDAPILARGRVERRSGRRLEMSGELVDGDRVAAEGRGVYLVSSAVVDL